MRFLAIVVLELLCCAVNAAEPAGSRVMENDQLRLVLTDKPAPFLRELVHKPSGRNLLAQPASLTLFSISLSGPGGEETVESQAAKQSSAEISRVDGGQRIVLTFAGLGKAELRVRLEGRLDDGQPVVRWSLVIDNANRRSISTVRFPYVTAAPAIGSPDDDSIVGPAFPGVLIENPAKAWPMYQSAAWSFPGDQSAQFFSYQDRTAGVYLASMDTVGHNRTLRISKRKNGYLLSHEYRLPEQPASQWRSPYEVALGVTAGAWQQTADLYKRWAERQPWCAKTLAQRNDIPAAWKRGPCIHTVSVRTHDASGKGGQTTPATGSYYPQLSAHLLALREKIGGPIVPMLAEWENHRVWTAGAYFPVFDAAHAGPTLAEIRRQGFSPFVFLSGMFFTFENVGPDAAAIPGAERHTASFVLDKEGKPKTYTLTGNSNENWKRHSYQFCAAASGAKPFFRSVIDQLHALGIDIVQMDQATNGAGDACYSTSHGHQVGPGAYQSQAFRDLLLDMRSHGRSLSPDFMLLNEELHEELIPYLDGFHTREFRERWWYRRAPGSRGIPLFTYLYHEYAIAYGGEGPSASKGDNPAVVREHAINLVTGKTPAVSVWSRQSAMAETHANQIHMLRNHTRLLATEAQQFLMLGRMLHPLVFDVPTVAFKIGVQRDKKWQPEPFEERAVLTSSWQSPAGLIGHCLVNITTTRQALQLQLDTRNAPAWPKTDVDLYRADNSGPAERLFRNVRLPQKYALELQPLEAVFFVLRPAK